jgi:hypothetical protein
LWKIKNILNITTHSNNPQTTTMLPTIASSSDIVFLIMQGVQDLNSLRSMSLTCRTVNAVVCGSELGRKRWLELGVEITSVGEDGFTAEDVKRHFVDLNDRSTFFPMLKQLVCPWLVVAESIPFRVNILRENHLLLMAKDGQRMIHHIEYLETATAFCPVPSGDDDAPQVVEYSTVRDQLHMPVMSEKIKALSKLAEAKKLVPDFSHDKGCEYRVFPVHAGVFAVSEVFSRLFDNGPELLDHGVYFFSHVSGRMLRHIQFDGFENIEFGCMVSRPTELWLLKVNGVDYFGPSCQARVVLNHAEHMDPALWCIGHGDAAGAIAYMHRIGAPLDTRSLISRRTLLHYAAKEGYQESVRKLLAAGFRDVDAIDDLGTTALYLATAELRSEVVEVLLKEAGASVDQGEYVIGGIGEFVQYRPYAHSLSRARIEIEETVPRILRLIMEAKPDAVFPDEDTICNQCILSCPEAVRMLCEKGEIYALDLIAYCFIDFRTRDHAVSAIGSFLVLVREFNADFNADAERYRFVQEYPLIHLAKHAIAEVVIAAIEFFGANPKVVGLKEKKTLRETVEKRLHDSNGGDEDALRMVEYFDSRGL